MKGMRAVFTVLALLGSAAALTFAVTRQPPVVPRLPDIQECAIPPAVTYATLLAVKGAVEGYGRINGLELKGEIAEADASIRFKTMSGQAETLANFDGILGFFTLMEQLPWRARYAEWCIGKECEAAVVFTLALEGKKNEEAVQRH